MNDDIIIPGAFFERIMTERIEAMAEVKRLKAQLEGNGRGDLLEYNERLKSEHSKLYDLLNRILGDDGPDVDAYLDGHVEAPHVPSLKQALKEARSELASDTCIDCGVEWPKCQCPNGEWWRDAGRL